MSKFAFIQWSRKIGLLFSYSTLFPIFKKGLYFEITKRITTPCPLVLTEILALFFKSAGVDFMGAASAGCSGFICGYLLHLLQDSFTISGIPVLYPTSAFKLSFSNAKSGSVWNYPVTIAIVFVIVLACFGISALKTFF